MKDITKIQIDISAIKTDLAHIKNNMATNAKVNANRIFIWAVFILVLTLASAKFV